MSDPNFVILYVKSPAESAALYAGLLGKTPVEASPGFVMFVLDSGLKLGLWATHTVAPAATPIGGSELVFAADGTDSVKSLHDIWSAKGLRIAQVPTQMDFGFTFVALDLDGHRLRVFAPTPA